MKYLTLILMLSNGEIGRDPMPAWECHSIAAQMHQAWDQRKLVDRSDGVVVIGAECVHPTILEVMSIPSEGPCEMEPNV